VKGEATAIPRKDTKYGRGRPTKPTFGLQPFMAIFSPPVWFFFFARALHKYSAKYSFIQNEIHIRRGPIFYKTIVVANLRE
jgi:hypothetical protein